MFLRLRDVADHLAYRRAVVEPLDPHVTAAIETALEHMTVDLIDNPAPVCGECLWAQNIVQCP